MNIKFSAPPAGQMGNRLFHYNLLWQISAQTNASCIHFRFKDHKYFYNLGTNLSFKNLFYKKFYFSANQLIEMGNEFISFLKKNEHEPFCIVLIPPFLGDIYIKFTFQNPQYFLKIRECYTSQPEWRNRYKNIIGLHFRGNDFYTWDKSAILPFKYYDDSLIYILESSYMHKDTALVLFTDDTTLPSYHKIKEKYSWLPIFSGNTQNISIYDFYAMSLCNSLISTPSTFSIWSGILGHNIRIIHNKIWTYKQVDNNNLFWTKVAENAVPFYNIDKLI